MKRNIKSIIALSLATCMSISSAVVVLAESIPIDEDKNITGWDKPNDTLVLGGDYTLTVDEGGEATVGGINGGGHDVTISGSGTLNVDSTGSDAISGQNVNINGTTVNATSDANVIGSNGCINIQGATVSVTGTGEFSGGLNGESGVTIADSDVTVTANGGHAIYSFQGDISIDNSNVNATSRADGAIFSEAGIIKLGDSVTITTPEGGAVGTPPYGVGSAIYGKDGPTGDYDTGVKSVVIKKGGVDPQPEPAPAPSPAPAKKEGDKDDNSNKSSGNADSNGTPLYVSTSKMIRDAAPNDTVTLYITTGTSLSKADVDAFEARKDVTLKIYYFYKGHIYFVTIPAGTDLTPYKNAAGGIDFETLTLSLGGTMAY